MFLLLELSLFKFNSNTFHFGHRPLKRTDIKVCFKFNLRACWSRFSQQEIMFIHIQKVLIRLHCVFASFTAFTPPKPSFGFCTSQRWACDLNSYENCWQCERAGHFQEVCWSAFFSVSQRKKKQKTKTPKTHHTHARKLANFQETKLPAKNARFLLLCK